MKKQRREPIEGVQYCHKDNSTMLQVKAYNKTKEMVTYTKDACQYTITRKAFMTLLAPREKTGPQ